ncbi:MAG: helix-turn-helix domain-containing protein [Bacillota bacterium]
MMELKRVGYNVMHPNGFTIDRPHGSGDYLFILFRSRMELRLDDRLQYADKNDYIIYRKGSGHYYHDAETPMIHDWFHFDGDSLDSYFDQLQLPLGTLVRAHDPFYISRKVQELQMEHIQSSAYRNEIIDATMKCLFLKLSAIEKKIGLHAPSSKYYTEFVNLRNEIFQSPQISFPIDLLASRVNMSRSYFQRIYKDLFSISVHTDMINNRLEYAMYLLENTSYSVSEVAALCGYDNDVHFMRQFKKKAGMTPTKYRSGYR